MEQIGIVMSKMLEQSEKKSSETSLRRLKSAGELKELLVDYAPNKQVALCRDKELCYFGNIPTLAELNRDYDPLAAVAFLIPQLTNVAEFANCKNSFGEGQIRSCAEMIATEYYYMKMSEMMLFFYKLKNGEYGQFYGTVSPMVIMGSLRQFVRERNDAILRHESKLREKRDEESKKSTMTAQEYFAPRAKRIISYFNAFVSVLTQISLTIKVKVQQ